MLDRLTMKHYTVNSTPLKSQDCPMSSKNPCWSKMVTQAAGFGMQRSRSITAAHLADCFGFGLAALLVLGTFGSGCSLPAGVSLVGSVSPSLPFLFFFSATSSLYRCSAAITFTHLSFILILTMLKIGLRFQTATVILQEFSKCSGGTAPWQQPSRRQTPSATSKPKM